MKQSTARFRRLGLLVLVLCVGCAQASTPEISPGAVPARLKVVQSKQDAFDDGCFARGGTPTYGLLAERLCQLKTTDGGKECTSSEQCQTACIAFGGEDGQPATGECASSNINLGCPAFFVEDGRVITECVE